MEVALRALLILVLLVVAGCGDATGPGRDLTGEWYLTASADSACQMIARIRLTRGEDGFTGRADVGFSRREAGVDVEWGGTGFSVHAEYPHISIVGYDLIADHWTDDRAGGTWTCGQTVGTWAWERDGEE